VSSTISWVIETQNYPEHIKHPFHCEHCDKPINHGEKVYLEHGGPWILGRYCLECGELVRSSEQKTEDDEQ